MDLLKTTTRLILHATRMLSLYGMALPLALTCLVGRPTLGADRPNIILMMVDDFGYESLSCNGGGPYKTPILDGLAKEGIRFTNCHSQPLCTPSRVQIMTGRYNFRNYRTFGELSPKETTFGHLLKSAGYKTCIVGKWQLGRDRELIEHFGFDEYCLWWLENKSDRYMDIGELIQNGTLMKDLKGHYGPDVVSDFMLDFISRHQGSPFFCYYPMILTHSPFVPTPDSSNPESKEDMPNFVDMVEYTDKIVGKIVSHLEGLGIRENTLILFTGDNGTAGSITSTLNGLPWKGGKGTPHESGTHVPLVASWPESQVKGKVLDDLVDFSDFFPTLAELSGAEIPAGVELDGRSFAPQLNGKRGNPREWIYFWYNGKGEQESPPRTPVQWLRGKRFKLYDSGDFFDMLKDPAQKKALPPRNMSPEAKTAYEGLKPALQEMEQLAVRKRFQ